MRIPVPYLGAATEALYDEAGYLQANPDVAAAVASGVFATGLEHFRAHGCRENRQQTHTSAVFAAREAKIAALRRSGLLRKGGERATRGEHQPIDCLTDELSLLAGIEATDLVSSHHYDPRVQRVIDNNPDAWILDAGSGLRPIYFPNVVNFEIVAYATTDVLGIAEQLPFEDNSFDYVLSAAVLEHVKDPFTAAREIIRVLKPGGELYCTVPFLQPYHGYPHHYFNMTHTGLASLFNDSLQVLDHTVPDYLHPIHTLTWLVGSWANGLQADTQQAFLDMTIRDFMSFTPAGQPFLTQLALDKQFELACGTMLHAQKPE